MQLYRLDVENATLADEDISDSNTDDERITSSIPLVVNTMGWTKGLGADLARKVEEIVEPTSIFSFVSPEDEWTSAAAIPYPLPPTGSDGPRIHPIEAIPPSPLTSHYTAADHRTLSLLSYFHAIFPPPPASPSPYTSSMATHWMTSLPLCAHPPYEVDCRAAFDQLVLTGAGAEDVVPSELAHALNCSIVALVASNDDAVPPSPPGPSAEDGLPYEQGAPPPSPHTSRCLGLALVRALSPSPSHPHTNLRLHLLTPLPPALLGSARTLVKGELQLPVWGMLDGTSGADGGVAGYERARVPFLRWGKGEGAGGERRRVRRNLMRRGQA